MGDRPLTTTLLVGFVLFGLLLWRKHRLVDQASGGGGDLNSPDPGSDSGGGGYIPDSTGQGGVILSGAIAPPLLDTRRLF